MPIAGGPARRLIRAARTASDAPVWSSDGATPAVPDEEHGLWLVTVQNGHARRVAVDPITVIRDPCFSPTGDASPTAPRARPVPTRWSG